MCPETQHHMIAFRAAIRTQIPATNFGVLFAAKVPVALTIHFHMKRPLSDFKGNHGRGAEFLKEMAARVRPIRPDIDNLAKFVLDGLNGLVYHDDRQVVKLEVYKLMDSEGQCNGRIVIHVERATQHTGMF